jgi:hypothetical protein
MRPSSIIRSISRREAIPARASSLAMRWGSPEARGAVGAGRGEGERGADDRDEGRDEELRIEGAREVGASVDDWPRDADLAVDPL